MGYTLLIADDERLIREGIEHSCDWEALGIAQVLSAADGREALGIINSRRVDILLTDIVMPEIAGLELCAQVKREHPCILTYLLTGHSDFTFARQAIQAGVRGYLLKPVDSAELTKTMASAVKILDRREGVKHQAMRLADLDENLPPQVSDAIKEFVDDVMSDWSLVPTPRDDKPDALPACENLLVQQLQSYVEEHIADSNLSLTNIASTQLFVNPDYLSKLFKKEMGVRFSTYLLNRRVWHAQQYLAEYPHAKVYEVAQAVGFGENPSYFSSLYKKVTGSTIKY